MQGRKRSGASHKHVVIRGEKQALSQGRAAVREVTGDVGRRQLVIRAQVRSPALAVLAGPNGPLTPTRVWCVSGGLFRAGAAADSGCLSVPCRRYVTGQTMHIFLAAVLDPTNAGLA